jgi:2-pyrone-4,6-dicarboxylate lactonase
MAVSAESTAMPAGACDCHAHIFGTIDRYPLAQERSYQVREASMREYLSVLGAIGFSRGVLVQPSAYGTDNRCLLDQLLSYPDRFRGIAVVDVAVTDHELYALAQAGVRGIRFLPGYRGGINLDQLWPLAQRIKPLGWHVQLAFDVSQLPDLDLQLEDLPVPIVFDHFGMVASAADGQNEGFRTLVWLLRNADCWVKTSAAYRCSPSGPPYTDAALLMSSLLEAAPTRLLWGTDWPHFAFDGVPPDAKTLLELFEQAVTDPVLKKTILVDNPTAIYGLN